MSWSGWRRPWGWLMLLVLIPARAAEYSGVLEWSQRVELSAPVSGVVEAVHVVPGQTVQAGQPLMRLDLTPFKAQVAELRAEVDRHAEELADAKRELERAQELYARTVTSTTELDAAKLRHARAAAGHAAAQARLERARWQLAQAELLAPFNAVVLARRAEPGMTVAAHCQPPVLLSLARADEIFARVRLSAHQAAAVHPGMPAEVAVAGTTHVGVVRSLTHEGGGEAPYALDVVIPRREGHTAGLPAIIRLP